MAGLVEVGLDGRLELVHRARQFVVNLVLAIPILVATIYPVKDEATAVLILHPLELVVDPGFNVIAMLLKNFARCCSRTSNAASLTA